MSTSQCKKASLSSEGEPAMSSGAPVADEGRAFKSGFPRKSSTFGKVPPKGSSVFGMLNSASEAVGSLSSLYGSFSGGYGSKKDDCEGISLALLLTTFASIGVVFFAVFTKLTMVGKRKKRSVAEEIGEEVNPVGEIIDNLGLIVTQGILRRFWSLTKKELMHETWNE